MIFRCSSFWNTAQPSPTFTITKICSGWHERNLHFGKLFLQISATFVYNPLGFAQVRFIIERRDRAGVCNAVHVEWLSCLVKHFSHLRRRDGIPDADPGKTVNLRELYGAQRHFARREQIEVCRADHRGIRNTPRQKRQ